jgi:putative ABC transport system permease protein
VSALTLMLRRDLWHLRGQVLAAALVVACGISAFVTMRTTYHALIDARDSYYAAQGFADIFLHLRRAPEETAAAMAAIPGVAAVQTRITADLLLDVPGLGEPASGRLVSLPDTDAGALNRVLLRRGRLPGTQRDDEVLVSEVFAQANHLVIGDHVAAILNGRWKDLHIVGTGLSPEYVYEVGPGTIFPDNRRFGVIWMRRRAMANAFDMDGAFNDVSLSLLPGASTSDVLSRLDRMTARYGGLGAYARSEQPSNLILGDELGEIEISSTYIPGIFLSVAAFLLYIVLGRVIAMQRAEIALLKAFGYSSRRIGIHYLLFALATVTLGAVAGIVTGLWLCRQLLGVYRQYFHFPDLAFSLDAGVIVMALLISFAAAAAGAYAAVRRTVRLAPAEAMRPEAPARFHHGVLDRVGLARLPLALRMIARNIARRPVRTAGAVAGIAFAVSLVLVGQFMLDAVNHIMDVQFARVQRDDVTVVFNVPRSPDAAFALTRLPGVLRAEPFRSVPAWLRHGPYSKRIEVTGLAAGTTMRQPLSTDLQPLPVPDSGIVLSARVARILHVQAGDTVTLEALEGARPVRDVVVAGVADEFIGTGVYMRAGALARLLGEDRAVSGAFLQVDPLQQAALYRRLKQTPAVSGIAVREAMRASIRDALDRSFTVSSAINIMFAGVIIAGVIYNSARISLSERGNELASLRVLGFSGRETATILLGEQAVLVVLAMLPGLLLGMWLCALLVPVFDREMFRLPLYFTRLAFAVPALAALLSALLAALLVATRLRHLDLIAVLKTRE